VWIEPNVRLDDQPPASRTAFARIERIREFRREASLYPPMPRERTWEPFDLTPKDLIRAPVGGPGEQVFPTGKATGGPGHVAL